MLVGADGTVRYANPAAARLLGTRGDDLVGTDIWGSVSPNDRPQIADWWERVLSRPGERLATTTRFLTWGTTLRTLCVLGTNLLPDPEVRAVTVQLRAVDGV